MEMYSYSYTGEGRQPSVLACSIVFFIVTPAIVAIRIFSRLASGVGLWWDDWTAIAAFPFILAFNCLESWDITLGLGAEPSKHVLGNLTTFFAGFFGEELIYDTGLTLVKVSILLLYVRVFPTREMTIVVWILALMVIGWFVGTGFAIIFQCTPVKKAWLQQEVKGGKCLDVSTFVLGQALSSIIIDCAIFVAPIRPVFQLQMPTGRKMAISGIFLLGFFAVACSVIRVPYALSSPKGETPESKLYDFTPGEIWTNTEMNICLICACLPTIRPVLSRASSRIFGTSTGTRGPSAYKSRGYRQTTSMASVSQQPKDSEGNSRLLSGIDFLKSQGKHTSTVNHGRPETRESDDIELGELSHHTRSRQMDRVLEDHAIHMRRDVEVYTERDAQQDMPQAL